MPGPWGLHAMLCLDIYASNVGSCELQVDIVPREERDDAAMMPRVPQPMAGAMPGQLSSLGLALGCL